MTLTYQDHALDLYHGDALAVLAELPDACVDAVICDPPYSSGGMVRADRMGSTRTKYVVSDAKHDLADFGGDNRDQRGYQYWCALWLAECLRITKPGGVLCQFTDWRQLPATTDAIQAGGWVWRGLIPWIKPNARPQQGRFTSHAEYVVWGTKGPRELAGDIMDGYFMSNPPRSREHITQKPMDVMRHLVRIAPEGGRVLDPFMGSGTTGAAAVLEGRRFIGIEHSEHYVDVAERRIRTAAGQAVDGADDQPALDFDTVTA
ncbi:DNA-methyltransferase [Mycolicibacterium mucogenicum]|uniref:DNA-methyltransferase n=1 Tax=Mycolicibacterium mucogenicum TaxID=56689 RepID=UPI0009E862C9|nr:site-specific DNA-methyltransferase [Mycolicibacterium mucogenicum]